MLLLRYNLRVDALSVPYCTFGVICGVIFITAVIANVMLSIRFELNDAP